MCGPGCTPGYGSWIPDQFTADFSTSCWPSRAPSTCTFGSRSLGGGAAECRAWSSYTNSISLFGRSTEARTRQARCEAKRASSRFPFLGKCACFPCPPGFTSLGGPIQSTACVPATQRVALTFTVAAPCADIKKDDLGVAYKNFLLAQPGVISSSVVVDTSCESLVSNLACMLFLGVEKLLWYVTCLTMYRLRQRS